MHICSRFGENPACRYHQSGRSNSPCKESLKPNYDEARNNPADECSQCHSNKVRSPPDPRGTRNSSSQLIFSSPAWCQRYCAKGEGVVGRRIVDTNVFHLCEQSDGIYEPVTRQSRQFLQSRRVQDWIVAIISLVVPRGPGVLAQNSQDSPCITCKHANQRNISSAWARPWAAREAPYMSISSLRRTRIAESETPNSRASLRIR